MENPEKSNGFKYIGEMYHISRIFLLPILNQKEEICEIKSLRNLSIKEASEIFKIECEICNGKFKNWNAENGINNVKWYKDKYYYILKLDSIPLYSLDIDKGLKKVTK